MYEHFVYAYILFPKARAHSLGLRAKENILIAGTGNTVWMGMD